MSCVVIEITRPDPEIVAALERCGVATVHEAQDRTGLMLPHVRPVYRGTRIAGPVVTVSVPPADNWMIHVAVEQCRAGDIMVVAPTSPSDAGYFGELLACSLQARGVKGLAIEAGVRDVAALEAMGFPVWAKDICARGTVKETLGSVNMPLICAGVLVRPGDIVVADDDGVVIVPRETASEVLAQCHQREAREKVVRERLKAGELGMDIYGMREKLAAKGLRYMEARATGVHS